MQVYSRCHISVEHERMPTERNHIFMTRNKGPCFKKVYLLSELKKESMVDMD